MVFKNVFLPDFAVICILIQVRAEKYEHAVSNISLSYLHCYRKIASNDLKSLLGMILLDYTCQYITTICMG